MSAAHAEAIGLIEAGWKLHSEPGDDPDLALLEGDKLYAQGLLGLVEIGDLEAVRALADVISECAASLAERDPSRAERAWETGARRVGRQALRG